MVFAQFLQTLSNHGFSSFHFYYKILTNFSEILYEIFEFRVDMRKFLLYYYLETGRILYIRMDKIEVPGLSLIHI